MKRTTVAEIINVLESISLIDSITIKDNAIDTKREFTLDEYNSNEHLNADYICFRFRKSDDTNIKQFRNHFESSKRIVTNVHYREFLQDNVDVKIKKSSIDIDATDIEKALNTLVIAHIEYEMQMQKRDAIKITQERIEKALA